MYKDIQQILNLPRDTGREVKLSQDLSSRGPPARSDYDSESKASIASLISLRGQVLKKENFGIER